jgi:hypothetical protein
VSGPRGLKVFNEFVEEADSLIPHYKWLEAIEAEIGRGATTLPPLAEVERARPNENRLRELRAEFDRYDGDEDDPRYENGYLSTKYVVERLGVLIGSYANARPGSPEIFSHTMVEHVIANDPTPCSLETTCRKLIERENKPYTPETCEVVAMLKRENELWYKRRVAIQSLADEAKQPRRIAAAPLVPLDAVREDQLEGVPA